MSQAARTSSVVTVKIAVSVLAPSSARSRSWPSYRSPFARAEAKIVGLVVTPTTCRPVMSDWSSPLASSSRERSSSHTATPCADSSASGSWRMSLVMVGPSGSSDDGVDRLFQRAGLGGRPGRFLPGLLESGPEFLKLFAAEAGPHFGEPVLLFLFDVMRDVLDQHRGLGVEALSPGRHAG